MKKAAIGTWYIGYNLGAVLQAYALNYYINEYTAMEADEIQYIEHPHDASCSYAENIKLALKGKGIKSFFSRMKIVPLCKKKKKLIDEFRASHIRQTQPIVERKELRKLNEQYDTFICGSDQIWNPHFLNTAYMFDYTAEAKTRISYAASLGVNVWPKSQWNQAAKLLNRFKHISVREDSAEQIVRELSDCPDVKHVCDPVLLLSQKKWHEVGQESRKEIRQIAIRKYVFCYLLKKNEHQMKLIRAMAAKENLQIVNLIYPAGEYSKEDKAFGDIKLEAISPQEFVYLIENAERVMTDSFHCVMFSIIFKKQFLCFKRDDYKGMNVRMDSILKSVGMEERSVLDCASLEEIDFMQKAYSRETMEKIQAFRSASMSWLNYVLGQER